LKSLPANRIILDQENVVCVRRETGKE